MYNLQIDKRVTREMRNYLPKVYKQVMSKIISLQFNPRPHDSKKIGLGFRVDKGEYRIYYQVNEDEQLVEVLVVGKRNDDEVYKVIRRMGLV